MSHHVRDLISRQQDANLDGDPWHESGYNPLGNRRQRWGARVLLGMNATGATALPLDIMAKQTFVDTQQLGINMPIDVRARFAPVQDIATANLVAGRFDPDLDRTGITIGYSLVFTIRRAVDPLATVTTDVYTMSAGGNTLGQFGNVLPFDILSEQFLGIDVELVPVGGSDGLPGTGIALWVELLASPVTQIGTADKVTAYPFARVNAFPTDAVAATLLLRPRAGRAQFIVVNTSTTSNLYLFFAPGGSILQATVVLPKNTFARYDSPIGGCWGGFVSCIWDIAGDGGVFITEGSYY